MLVIFLCIATFCKALLAQVPSLTTDNIRWHTSELKDIASNVSSANVCQFITYGNSKIDWVQDNGNYITHWTIKSVTGEWSNLNNNGSVSFMITDDQLNGLLIITKSDQGVYMVLKINDSKFNINVSYTISSYEKL